MVTKYHNTHHSKIFFWYLIQAKSISLCYYLEDIIFSKRKHSIETSWELQIKMKVLKTFSPFTFVYNWYKYFVFSLWVMTAYFYFENIQNGSFFVLKGKKKSAKEIYDENSSFHFKSLALETFVHRPFQNTSPTRISFWVFHQIFLVILEIVWCNLVRFTKIENKKTLWFWTAVYVSSTPAEYILIDTAHMIVGNICQRHIIRVKIKQYICQ